MEEVFNILKFELTNWDVLKKIFVNINEIIDEIVIQCNPEGLKFNALDRSHICFFECVISKKVFDNFEIDSLLDLTIDVNDLVKVLKRGTKKDSLIFKANNETFEVIFKNKNVRTFVITQIDMDDNSRELPKMDFSTEFECDFDIIINSLKDADLYSDRLTFECKDSSLNLSCEGSFGKYFNEIDLLKSFEGENCSATYGIDWLFKIFNTKLSSDCLKIFFGKDYPMLVEMGIENIKLNYLLAPRIENE